VVDLGKIIAAKRFRGLKTDDLLTSLQNAIEVLRTRRNCLDGTQLHTSVWLGNNLLEIVLKSLEGRRLTVE
jgi:hypothetical protein